MALRACNVKRAPNCTGSVTRHSKTGSCVPCSHIVQREQRSKETAEVSASVGDDRQKAKLTAELSGLRDKYKVALATIDTLERQVHGVNVMAETVSPLVIEPRQGSGTSEATVVAIASDWHVEERVDPATVSGLNEYSVDIATQRATRFFQGVLRLTRLLQQDVRIDNVVLALLGDFVSGQIHEEFAEINEQTPMHAIVTVQNMLIGGIRFLLDHTEVSLTIPCHSGNHARTTKTTRFGAENGHSLEYLLYMMIAKEFQNEPRVRFHIATGMHSYLDIYGQTYRFQHGHAIKYGGGVGGIYIPVNKAIAQWNRARPVVLDVFGHFHQYRDGGNFICNGSLIGYNSFALSIKADFEQPRQALFLIDKRRGRTANWPILVN
jgi:alkylated DNA nucleotide flippase Atl1